MCELTESPIISHNSPQLLIYYQSHRRDLVAYASKILGDYDWAEDIIHDAYLRFIAMQAETEADYPLSYLYRIVRNLSLDRRRRHKFERALFANNIDELAHTLREEHATLEYQAITNNKLEKLLAAVNELPERTRLVVAHRLSGFKLHEIAKQQGITISLAQHLVREGIKYCRCRCV